MKKNYKILLNDVTTFIFDIDGVLTDGRVLVTTEGEMLRSMNAKDGYALKVASQKGYNICIISAGTNPGVRERLKALGITYIHLGIEDKKEVLATYLKAHNINPKNVLYMGDDLPDLPPMQQVAIATSPQDAVAEVKAISDYISHKKGGEGCVRDIIEQVLKARGDWFSTL